MKERKKYIEYLRIIATLAVVMNHIFTTSRTDFVNHSFFQDMYSLSVSHCLHFAVPIFLMITGSLFLNNNKNISLKTLYKKYILKYLGVILLFGTGFSFIEILFNEGFSPLILLKAVINTLNGNTWEHMWYMYMLVGVMAIIPFVKILIQKLLDDDQYLKYFIGICIFFNFFVKIILNITNYSLAIDISIFNYSVTYLVLGYLIDIGKIKLNLKNSAFVTIISIILLILTNIMLDSNYIEISKCLGGYDSPLILIYGVGLFSLFKNLDSVCVENKIILFLTKYSFGVYIIHMFWINLLTKFFKINIYEKNMILMSLICFILVSLFSYVSSYILKKIPCIRKLL